MKTTAFGKKTAAFQKKHHFSFFLLAYFRGITYLCFNLRNLPYLPNVTGNGVACFEVKVSPYGKVIKNQLSLQSGKYNIRVIVSSDNISIRITHTIG